MGSVIEIDASFGEGGGQILRSALALSLLTGRALRLSNIRLQRPKPGLQPQHLAAVLAAAAVGSARVEGAARDSTTLQFTPRALHGGDYRFDIGTAGATSLVLQTVFVPLAFAAHPSHVTLIGGTHVPWSPSYHYLERHWLPWLRTLGFAGELRIVRAGFYPPGGGSIDFRVQPSQPAQPLLLASAGALRRVHGISAVARLPLAIAARQRARALQRLQRIGVPIEIEIVNVDAVSPGTFLFLAAEFEHTRLAYTALGARGKLAEVVADEVADEFDQDLAMNVVLDRHCADQLLLPLALVPHRSEIGRCLITRHLLTNAEVLRRFLPVEVAVDGALGKVGRVAVAGVRLPSPVAEGAAHA